MRSRLSIKPAHIFLFALLLGPALFDGCSQSQMTDVWKDPSYNEGTMKKVFAVAVRRDPVRRRIWEDAFVEELKATRFRRRVLHHVSVGCPGLFAGERRRAQGRFRRRCHRGASPERDPGTYVAGIPRGSS